MATLHQGHTGAGHWSLELVTWEPDDLGHMAGAGQGSVCHWCVSGLVWWPVCHCMSVCHSHRVLAQPALSSTLGSGLLTLGSAPAPALDTLDHTASLTNGAATTVLTVQGWARAHSHWKAASPGL